MSDLNEKLFHTGQDKSLSLIDLLSIIDGSREVDDNFAIQSVVGLLGNASKLFSIDDKTISLVPGYRLKGLSSLCSKSVLLTVSRYANHVLSLSDTIGTGLRNEENETLTYLTYLLTLRDVLISVICKPTLKKSFNTSISILNFLDYLDRSESGFMLGTLDFLNEITACLKRNPRFAANIIDTLLCYLSLDNIYDSWIVLQLFLSAIRPSLDYLELLLTNGEITDPREEFFFKLKIDLSPDSFWTDCIEVRNGYLPRFFEPYLDKLLVGIKSRLIIKMFDKNKGFRESTFPKISLFKSFVNELKKNFPEGSFKDKISSDFRNVEGLRLRLDKPDDIVPQRYNYLSLENLTDVSLQDYDFNCPPDYAFEHLVPLSKELLAGMPIKLALQKSFGAAIKTFIEPIDVWLLKYVRSKFTKHLMVFDNYFLLQRSTPCLSQYFDCLFRDITGVDNIIQQRILWQSYTFPDDEVKAFVSYIRDEQKLTNLMVLDKLHLVYEQTDRISRTIISVDSRGVYDNAFQMLTHVMYARWILQNLKFRVNKCAYNCRIEQDTRNTYAAFHHLYLTRHRLLFIANNLYNFMMNNIQNSVEKLYASNATASDYQQLRKNFNRFIKCIKLITLQTRDENIRVVRRLIRSLIKICCELDQIWRREKCTLEEVCEFKERSNIENIEKALKIFYYKCFNDMS